METPAHSRGKPAAPNAVAAPWIRAFRRDLADIFCRASQCRWGAFPRRCLHRHPRRRTWRGAPAVRSGSRAWRHRTNGGHRCVGFCSPRRSRWACRPVPPGRIWPSGTRILGFFATGVLPSETGPVWVGWNYLW